MKNATTGEIIYTPPQDYNTIRDLMTNLEQYINDPTMSDFDTLVKMAIIHYQFESIHPFYDGNGRTGRIINVLYLVMNDLLNLPVLYLSRYIIEHKVDYYKLLQEVRETDNWENWILYMLDSVEQISKETIVLIGEIRDLETSEIAVQASLTGHLVLSTLHTNSAVGSITRLMDMGVEPFLISSSMVGIVAQRLVRVLCTHCREPYQPAPEDYEFLKHNPREPITIYRPKGCSECSYQGYKGRLGIYEVIEIDDQIKSMIHKRGGEMELEAQARKNSPSIQDDGIAKVLAGLTSIDEVVRVTHRDNLANL